MNPEVYLDYNGSAPLDPRVLEVMLQVLRDGVGNASAIHRPGRTQAARVERAREQVAQLVGASPAGVVFTAGATEANNLVLQGLVAASKDGRSRILISATEHASVQATAAWLAQQAMAKVDIVPVTSGGAVDLDALKRMLGDDVIAVSVMAANSETGVLNDLEAIGKLAGEVGALSHSDATQLVGRVEFDMRAAGVDAVSISGHKICGPTGVGSLIATRSAIRQLRPVLHGGGHERGLRSGSLNVAGIVGLGAASVLAHAEQAEEAARVEGLRDALVAGLTKNLEAVTENGDTGNRLPNTANVRFADADGDAVMANLDSVAVSSGSACSAGALGPSPVLLAMGLDRQAAEESLRFSLGRFTTARDIDTAVAATVSAVEYVRTMSRSA